MKDGPPTTLVDLLASLGLATASELRGMSGRVRRLADGLPEMESLWIDALVQSRLLTTWQAVEINAGRGPSLKVGPFVIFDRLAKLGYATIFRARELDGDRFVRLSIASNDVDRDDAERRLTLLIRKVDELSVAPLVPIVQHGRDGGRLWAASGYFSGRTARQWMLGHGRMPPATVLEIANRLLQGLVVCERAGVVHADIGADAIWFDVHGRVRLPEPGLRGVLLPMEGGQPDLPAEAYDYLAPERVSNNSLADFGGDVYACGAFWWHLLTGRPPFAGATAASKLRSAQTTKPPDIRKVAADTPELLADAVMSCLARAPENRPKSLAALAATLGKPTSRGQRRLAKLLREVTGPARIAHQPPETPNTAPYTNPKRQRGKSLSPPRLRFGLVWAGAQCGLGRHLGHASGVWRRFPQTSRWVAATVGILVAVTMIAWSAMSPRRQPIASAYPIDRSGVADGAEEIPAPEVREVETLETDRFGPATTVPEDEGQERNEFRSTSPVARVDWQEPDEVVEVSADDASIALANVRSGQTLRGNPERRPSVEVPPEGIELAQTDVILENFDFVARQPLAAGAAMLTLRGLKTTLRGCSFQTAGDLSPDEPPAAVRWQCDIVQAEASDDLSTSDLQIRDVTFRRVAVGVTCRLSGGMAVRFDNVLCLDAGPAVQLDRFPATDESALVSFSRVTSRGARSLVEVGCDQVPAAAGNLEIEALDCVFVLPAAAALVVFDGEQRPGPLLRGLSWSGQGSVLSPRSRLAIWRMPSGRMLAAADAAVAIEGVVRGDVGFAGSTGDAPAGSRIVRWQAPFSSSRQPGIDDSGLSLPPVDE